MSGSPRTEAQRLGAQLAGLDDDRRKLVAQSLGADAVLERALRVRTSLVDFARENSLLERLARLLGNATTDRRTRLERLLDGLREALYDSRPFPRTENPDLCLAEAQELLTGLAGLSEIARLRAASFLAGGLPATVTLEAGNERAVIELFRRFSDLALTQTADPTARATLEETARVEAELLDRINRGRTESSDAGRALSAAEMEQLLRLVDRLPEARRRLYLDALAAICLPPFTFAPGPDSPNATAEAQLRLADRFWREET